MKKRLSRQVGRAYCKPSQDVRLADVIPAWYVAICLHVEAGAHHACVHDLFPCLREHLRQMSDAQQFQHASCHVGEFKDT